MVVQYCCSRLSVRESQRKRTENFISIMIAFGLMLTPPSKKQTVGGSQALPNPSQREGNQCPLRLFFPGIRPILTAIAENCLAQTCILVIAYTDTALSQ